MCAHIIVRFANRLREEKEEFDVACNRAANMLKAATEWCELCSKIPDPLAGQRAERLKVILCKIMVQELRPKYMERQVSRPCCFLHVHV